MKRQLKRTIKKVLAKIGNGMLNNADRKRIDRISAVDKMGQMHLSLHYQQLLRDKAPLPSFDDVEFSAFSDNGEDGILHFIFSLVGTSNKRAIEICAGIGKSCNTANLIVNHGWTALLIDGDPENVREGKEFFSQCDETRSWPPVYVNAWITAENINTIIKDAGFDGEIDLLSLDIDGMDYWVWKAMDCINPRVVVLEFQNILGPDRSVTVPYDPNFVAEFENGEPNYAGASLAAFVKIGKEKGYRLVGCQRYGYNAFFIRSDIGEDIFPEVTVASCFTHSCSIEAMKRRYPLVADKIWEEV